MKSAQTAATNWANSAGRATTAYTEGVNAFTGDWAGATTAQQATMLANVTAAVTSGRWAAGVQRVGTAGWKTATQAKSANYGTGFTAGAARQSAAITKIVGALQNIVPSLPPRGDFSQNVQRSVALQTQLHALKGTLGA